MSEKIARIALIRIPGLSHSTFKKLIHHFGSATEVFESAESELRNIPGVNKVCISSIKRCDLKPASDIVSRLENMNGDILFFDNPSFPAKLKQQYDSPSYLYFKGNPSYLNMPSVSIVGTRKATRYGKQVLDRLVCELSTYNVAIISGLAFGIDYESHRLAVENDIPTYGVMGNGINIVYPKEHSNLVSQMTENGGILTEYTFDVDPHPKQFPARNRIIAGMSEVTIVVEAAERGGALITADFANQYDREVFAVPGNLTSLYSRGCNELIKKHKAHIFTNVESMCSFMNWQKKGEKKRVIKPPSNMSREESLIYKTFQETDPLPVEEISQRTDLPLTTVLTAVLQMELKGMVKSYPGNSYARIR